MPLEVHNVGSAARDFCMIERNLLSHFKLALLLSLISSSVLLRAKLTSDEAPASGSGKDAALPMATLQMVAALISVGAGLWEYQTSCQDLRDERAFLAATKPHFAIMTIVAGVVLTTCVLLLAEPTEL
ncbi:hypothetical protein JAAARDRAFT_171555 [Jaapia argillacea MUCL 33604]|uniref:DUF202 domain-containing protein n=1 Tax=Jaapia argillacea MUCL 33604 TaxID=933084 RepID=A0A067QCY8_9AGAM|nr:hypothetical protein JAAARDRAFT_171555 [Jaapia argillacea MUCL 33604]